MTDRERLDALVRECFRNADTLDQLAYVMESKARGTRPKRLAEEKHTVARNYRGIASNLRSAVARANIP